MITSSLLAAIPCFATIVLTAVASYSPPASSILKAAGSSRDIPSTDAMSVPSSRGLTGEQQEQQQRLAVVVPTQPSDLFDVLDFLAKWPHLCYPRTLQHVDLVMLLAEKDQPQPGVLEELRQGGGRCFANTRIVLGDKFIEVFLDEEVRPNFDVYDAISVLDWDVEVANSDTFDKLYTMAFEPSIKPYWIKASQGRTLDPRNTQGRLKLQRDREGLSKPLSHPLLTWTINGKAVIYNNRYLESQHFIYRGLSRWAYDHPVDVALWAALSTLTTGTWTLHEQFMDFVVLVDMISAPENEQSKGALFLERVVGASSLNDPSQPYYDTEHHDENGADEKNYEATRRNEDGYPYRYYDDDYFNSEYIEEYYWEHDLLESKISEGEREADRLAAVLAFRKHMCAFIPGYAHQRRYAEVTVKSILLFMPGMPIAIAVDPSELDEYQTSLGSLPGVTISTSEHVQYSALVADHHCGGHIDSIFYLEPGNLLSRKFTSEDTHTAEGDLLVMFTEARRASPGESRFAKASGSVLDLGGGPSFTSGTDVILPVSSNVDLRATLSDGDGGSYEENSGGESPCDDAALIERLSKFPDVYVPQVLASITYWMHRAGVTFRNPWEGKPFVHAARSSVANGGSDVSLKSRFGCKLDRDLASTTDAADSIDDFVTELYAQLAQFTRGVSCESGYFHLPDDIAPEAPASLPTAIQ